MSTMVPWRTRLKDFLGELPSRIRYTRKGTEQEDRQAHPHAQQDEACDKKWGPLDPIWIWRDSQSGRSFDREGLQDLVDFCQVNPRPRSDPGVIEMWDPARIGRIVDEATGRPDMNAFLLMYLGLEQCGWVLRFVTVDLPGLSQLDISYLGHEAVQAAAGSRDLSNNASRG